MLVNIDTNYDEQMKKLNELLAKYEELEEKTKQMHFITVKEFAKMRGCCLNIARKIFSLPDFPRRRFWKRTRCFY